MALFIEDQIRLDRRQGEAARYPSLFADMAAAWNSPGSDDRAWLLYSANYIFRTGGIRWAIDPLTMRWRVPETPEVDLRRAFDQLDFVLLTHRHSDHLDFDLLRALRQLPIHWVIPEFLLPEVQAVVGLPGDQIHLAHPQQSIDIFGFHMVPFAGLHWEASPTGDGRPHGVPAMGYRIEFNGKRWLFPGDTRNYNSNLLPAQGPLDGIFAHLWLGRGCARMDEPPLLDQFCQFYFALQPKRLFLTHLEEFGRKADDYWEDRHAQKVISRWKEIAPQIPIEAVRTGECVIL
jgi:hypothetical protein